MRTACGSGPAPPSQRERDGQTSQILGEIGPPSIGPSVHPFVCAHRDTVWFQGAARTGPLTDWKHKLLSVFPTFFPAVKDTACLVLSNWKKRMSRCCFSVATDISILDCCLSSSVFSSQLPCSGTFRGPLLVMRVSLGMSQK